MSYLPVEQLVPGDMFDASPFVEAEIERAAQAGDIPFDGWDDSLRQSADMIEFEVMNPVEVEDDPYGWVLVWAEPQNIMIENCFL